MCVFVGGGGRKHPLCFHVTYCPTAASSKLMCPEVGPKNLGHRHSWFCPTRFELTCSQARYGDETHQNEGSGHSEEKTHYTVANFPLCQ